MFQLNQVLSLVIPLIITVASLQFSKRQKQKQVDNILSTANKNAQSILGEANEFVEKTNSNIAQLKESSKATESNSLARINLRENSLQKRQLKLDKIHAKLKQQQDDLISLQSNLQNHTDDVLSELSKKSGINAFDAKKEVQDQLEVEFKNYLDKESAVYIKSQKAQSVKKALLILKQTMQRFTGASSVDKGSKLIKFNSKRAFELLCGTEDSNLKYLSEKMNVDIERTDEKNTLRVSAFVIWHQETVKLALKKLISCSKITPEIMDKQLDLATREFEQHLIRLGRKVADILELENRHPELLQILGRLKYRTSYGQNVLKHSLEVAFMSQMIASQIGANPREAFLGGFFHDVGKALDQVQDGSHDLIGAEFLRKHDFPFAVFHPAESHHYAIPPETVEAEIVIIADKLSASRQGARTESAEMYLQRVQGLERIATETPGVQKAYALSAGREIRSFVDSNDILDDQMQEIANQMASQISDEIIFPGKIKVNLIRTVQNYHFANKK